MTRSVVHPAVATIRIQLVKPTLRYKMVGPHLRTPPRARGFLHVQKQLVTFAHGQA